MFEGRTNLPEANNCAFTGEPQSGDLSPWPTFEQAGRSHLWASATVGPHARNFLKMLTKVFLILRLPPCLAFYVSSQKAPQGLSGPPSGTASSGSAVAAALHPHM